MSVETPHAPSQIEVEEEPDDSALAAIAETPLQLEAEAWTVWDKISPYAREQAERDLNAGISTFAEAEASDEREGLTAETVRLYQRAGRDLVNFRAAVLDEERELQPADAIILTMMGTSFARQAQAADVRPYQHPDYQPGGRFEHIDREVELFRLAHRSIQQARKIFTEADRYTAPTSIFEAASPLRAVAQAAVKAEMGIDNTAEHDLPSQEVREEVREETAELLKSEGIGVERLFERIERQQDARFIALWGKNILEEMVEPPEVIRHG